MADRCMTVTAMTGGSRVPTCRLRSGRGPPGPAQRGRTVDGTTADVIEFPTTEEVTT